MSAINHDLRRQVQSAMTSDLIILIKQEIVDRNRGGYYINNATADINQMLAMRKFYAQRVDAGEEKYIGIFTECNDKLKLLLGF